MRSIRFSVVLVGLAALCCAPVFADEPTVAEIFKTIHTQFTHLKTIDVSSRSAHINAEIEPDLRWTVDTARERAGASADKVQFTDYHLWLKDNLYRNCIGSFERTDFAFDGTAYQLFNHEHRVLRIIGGGTEKHMVDNFSYFRSVPFLRPYDFVGEALQMPMSVPMLRDAATWESLGGFPKCAGKRWWMGIRASWWKSR